MAIVVVCPNCLTTFQVKDKYAGKQGPCPKCRSVIKVPELDELVPASNATDDKSDDDTSPKRRPTIEPIERVSTKTPPWLIAVSGGGVILAIIIAFSLRNSELKSNALILIAGAILLAPPLVSVGYSILRDGELQPYRGRVLQQRAAICSLSYIALWGVIWCLKYFLIGDADSNGPWQYLYLLAPPILLGATTALATFDLDFGTGALHYSFYLGACAVLRLMMKLPPI
ncbi:MAG TPA: hypothetical protein VGI75_01260 [Pirellulales bacterium]|jgi:Zn-finger nucleic acid-binding protein